MMLLQSAFSVLRQLRQWAVNTGHLHATASRPRALNRHIRGEARCSMLPGYLYLVLDANLHVTVHAQTLA
jgi:hypothetical protein